LEETFLRVDGMHSAVSEGFLESVGAEVEGVEGVSASYVTGAVRVRHDGSVTEVEIRDRLSTAGHTAHLLREGTEAEDGGRGGDSVAGSQSRRDEPMLGIKHTVGVMLGGIILIPYVSLVYPGYVLSFLDTGMGYDLSAVDGTKFLAIYMGMTGIVLYFTGLPVLRGAYIGLLMRKPNADMVVSLSIISAYLYGTVAALAGRGDIYYDLTILIAVVVVSSIFYESLVKEKAVERLGELTSSRVSVAHRYADGGTEDVGVDELSPGDRILVREGERVPEGGVLETDSCTVDESVVTGESLPVNKEEGDEVIAGSAVTSGAAVVRVTDGSSAGVREITRGVWDIQAADHGAERRINSVAGYVVPALVVAGLAVGAGYFVTGTGIAGSVLATLTVFLAVSPWGLSLVAPFTSASGIKRAMEKGIVVFDETHFERLRDVDTVVFDKTGTLTTGEMRVEDTVGPEGVLRDAASLEEFSSHPAAEAISDGFSTGAKEVRDVETLSKGVSGEVGGETVLVGNRELFEQEGWGISDGIAETVEENRDSGDLPVVVGRGGEARAVVTLSDQHRDGWEDTVSGLSEMGARVVVLTGDSEEATRPFEAHEDVDMTFSEVPPKGKREAIRGLSEDGTVAMVGDGTNDALSLAEADFSVSMGNGTAVASDAADLAIVREDIRLVEEAFELSEGSRTAYRRSLYLSLLYNAVAVPLAVLGTLNPLLLVSAGSVTAAGVWASSSRLGPL
jgi:heavy metal translocating P-type ATPase